MATTYKPLPLLYNRKALGPASWDAVRAAIVTLIYGAMELLVVDVSWYCCQWGKAGQ